MPVGSVNWIHKFANLGTVNVFDIRSSELFNSGELTSEGLHLQAGGKLENSGKMNVGDLRVGVSDNDLFSSNDIEKTGNGDVGDTVLLPTSVAYDDENELGTSLTNSGTLNAGTAYVAATLTNTGAASQFNVGENLTVTKAVDNAGLITAKNANFGDTLTVQDNAQVKVTEYLSVLKSVDNAGLITAKTADFSDTLSLRDNAQVTVTENLSVTRGASNRGSIIASQATFSDTLDNKDGGSVTVDNLTVKGALTNGENSDTANINVKDLLTINSVINNRGSITAGRLDASQVQYLDIAGTVVLNQTSTGLQSRVQNLTNSGTLTTNHVLKATSVRNMDGARIDGEGSLSVDKDLSNAGDIDVSRRVVVSGNVLNQKNITASELFEGTGATSNNEKATLTAGKFRLNGTLTNAGKVFQTQANRFAESTFKNVENLASGTLSFKGDARLLNLTNKGTVLSEAVLTTTESTNNSGSIGSETQRVTKLVSGAVTNSGKIYAVDADFSGDVVNQATGVMDVSGTLNAKAEAGMTNKAGGQVVAGVLQVTNTLTNAGDLSAKQVKAGTFENSLSFTQVAGSQEQSTFGILNNTGNMTWLNGFKADSLNNASETASIAGTGNIELVSLTNKGVIGGSGSTLDLNVTGETTNSKTIEVNSAVFKTLTNETNGSITANEISVTSGTNNGTLKAKTALTVAGGEFVQQQGDLSAATLKLDNGKLNIAAAKSSQVSIDRLESSGNSAIKNVRDLVLGSVATTSGLTYEQTDGSLTIKDNTFFSDSTLNIAGGQLIRTEAGKNTLGTGNTVNLTREEKPTGEGRLTPDDNGHLKDTWRDGFTYVHVGLLDSGSRVTVNRGAILEADSVNLTSNSLTLNGGVLASGMSSFFTSVTEDFFTITNGDSIKLEDTLVLGTKDVGGLDENFKEFVTIGEAGATLVLTDEFVYLDAVASANEKLKEVFNTNNSSVVFTGKIADPTTRDNKFYHSTFEKLKAEQGDGSAFRDPGLVFSNMAYQNKTAASGVAKSKLVVGTTDTAVGADALLLDMNIGFMNVEGASEVVAQDGKTFALTGRKAGIELVGDANGKVTVTGAKSLFNLGNNGVAEAKGHLGTLAIENGGEFRAVKGNYTIDNIKLADGTTGTVSKDATLNVGAYTSAEQGTLRNEGVLNFDNAAAVELGGKITNANELNVKNAAATITGTFTNRAENSGAGLATFKHLTFASSNVTNAEGAKIVSETGFNVDSGSNVTSDGRLVSYGDNVINGELTVSGAGRVVAQGKTTVNNLLTMYGRGYYDNMSINDGTVKTQDGSILVVKGTLESNSSGWLQMGKGSQIIATSINVPGGIKWSPEGKLSVGIRAFGNFDNTQDAKDIKGDDYRSNATAMYALRAGMPEVSTERQYELSPSSFKTAVHNGKSMKDGGDDGTTDGNKVNIQINKATHLIGGTFGIDSDWHIRDSGSLTLDKGTKLQAVDTWLDLVKKTIETNVIVQNGGRIVANGDASYSNLVMADAGTYSLGATGHDQGSLLTLLGGTYSVAAGGRSEFDQIVTTHDTVTKSTGTIDNAGTLTLGGGTLGKGATLKNAGTLNVEETLNVGGTLTATAGSLSGNVVAVENGGVVTLSGTNINGLKTIRNAGSLTVDNANRFGSGNTYVHSGNATLATNGTWFEGTNLEFTDGAQIESNKLAADGTFGKGNNVRIYSDKNYTLTKGEPNKATFADFTKISVSKLTEDSKVSVEKGGYLSVGKLTGQADLTLAGGVLGLNVSELTDFYLDGVLLDKDEQHKIESSLYGEAQFTDKNLGGIVWKEGVVDLLTTKAKGDLNTILVAAAGIGQKSANVITVFNKDVEGAAADGTFAKDDIVNLLNEKKDPQVSNPGVVLTKHSLDAKDASGGKTDVLFAKKDGAIQGSIGFKSIKNAHNLTVEDGLTTSLVGTAGELDWSNDQKLLENSTDGGNVTISEGRVIFGNGATLAKNTGWIGTLDTTSKGKVEVKNFELGVKNATFGGETTVAANAVLAAEDAKFAATSVFTNNGLVMLGNAAAAAEAISLADEGTSAGAPAAPAAAPLVIAGQILGSGAWDLSAVPSAKITGTAQMGSLTANDVALANGAVLETSAGETGANLTLEEGSKHVLKGDMTWNKVKVDAGASDVWGSGRADEALTVNVADYVNEGTLNASNAAKVSFVGDLTSSGKTTFKNLDLKGDLVVNGGTFEASALTTQAGSNLTVSNGVLALNGMTAEEARSASGRAAVLGLGNKLGMNGGSLTVGTPASGATPAAGDVYFGADSALVVDTSKFGGNEVLESTGLLTVKKGSQLVVTNASWGKHMIVAKGMNTSGMDEGAWTNEDFINKTPGYMNIAFENGNVVLNVGKPGDTAIGSLSHDYIAPNVINGLIDTTEGAALRDVNSPYADVAFIDRMLDVNYAGALSGGELDLANSLHKMNSVIGFNAATGMDGYAHALMSDKMDRIDRRMHESQGLPERSGWVNLIGSKMKSDSLGLGNGEAGFDAKNNGLMLGADVAVVPNARIGAAFNYVNADVDSTGGVAATKSDAETYGFSVYGSYDFGRVRLQAQMGYDETKGDASQSFTDVKQNAYKVTGSTKARTFSLGISGEYAVDLGSFTVVPHAGVRLTHADYDAFDTHINGQRAFANDVESTDIVQMPVGASVQGRLAAGGWTLVPNADVTLVPQFGDTDSRVRVSATHFAGSDTYAYDVAGDFVGKVNLGLSAEKDVHRFGVSLDFSAGDKGVRNAGFSFDYRLNF